MIRSIKSILMLLATTAVMALTIFPIHADNIGVVDLEKVLARYKEATKVQQDLQKRRETYQKLFEDKNAKLEEVKKKSKKEEEIRKFIEKTEAELKPKQEELMKYEADQNRKLVAKIYETAEAVAKEYGIDAVFDKRALLSGGFDLTEQVITKLNK